MKDIIIIDNFINDEELEEARQFIGEESSLKEDVRKKFSYLIRYWKFNHGDNCYKKNIVDLRSPPAFFPPGSGMDDIVPSIKKFILKMKNRIDKYTNTNFKLERVYLNRQVYGQDVTLHVDGDKPNIYTLLIYIGDITPENYDKAGGDLELKTKEITRIEPFTKRAVLFKGYIPHQAYAPLVPDITRISMAFKFIDTSNELPFLVSYS
jgi:hypothetical protein